jgi:hypothetical protein
LQWLRGILTVVTLAGCLCAPGCESNQASAIRRLESRDPADRILAIHELAEQAAASNPGPAEMTGSALPKLVDRLEDEDEGVRFFAIVALEKVAGTRLGYRYSDPVDLRRRAVERWRRWVSAQAGGPPEPTRRRGSGDVPDIEGRNENS